MGSISSNQVPQFRFIQVIKDKNFGTIKVYRQNYRPYDYYMKLLLRTDPNDSYQTSFIQTSLQMMTHTPRYKFFPQIVTPINTSLQCNQMSYSVTLEYLNFTLADLLTHMLATKECLDESELNYVIFTVISVHKIRFVYSPETLFINIMGGLIVYPFGLSDGSHQLCENYEINEPQSRIVIKQPLICFNQNLCQLIMKITAKNPLQNTYLGIIQKIRKCRTLQEIYRVYPWESHIAVKIRLPGAREREKHTNQLSRQTIASYSTSFTKI